MGHSCHFSLFPGFGTRIGNKYTYFFEKIRLLPLFFERNGVYAVPSGAPGSRGELAMRKICPIFASCSYTILTL